MDNSRHISKKQFRKQWKIKKCSQIYVTTCNGGGGGGNTPPPITPVPTPNPTTEPINGIRYAKNNASAGGKQVNCGDEVYVTTCETLTSSTNPTCIVTK